MAQPSACATQVVGSQIPDVSTFGAQTYAFTTCQIALGVIPSPQILSRRLILRKIVPQVMAAAPVHSSTARFAHNGTGTVRIPLPPLPERSGFTAQEDNFLGLSDLLASATTYVGTSSVEPAVKMSATAHIRSKFTQALRRTSRPTFS